MPVTSEEIIKQIDIFLNKVSQKYITQLESIFMEEQFKKIIFSDATGYHEAIETLGSSEFITEAQQLRLLRMGMDLDSNNKRKTKVSLDGFQELSQILGVNGISQELECKLAYFSIVYYLSNGGNPQNALDYFVMVKNILKTGGFLPFDVLDPVFVKLYYSFCIMLGSCKHNNTGVHTAYDDFPFNNRLGNIKFEAVVVDYSLVEIPYMTWIDLQEKIAIVTVYQILSAKGYEEDQLCDPSYLQKAFDVAKTSVEQTMRTSNILARLYEYGNSRDEKEKASKKIMDSLFPERAAIESERENTIKATKERLEYLEEVLRVNKENRRIAEQQAISSINAWAAAAKKEANHQSYEKIKFQGGVMAATYVLAPYVAPVLAPAISGIAAGVGASTATATTISTTLAPVLAKAAVSTTLQSIVSDDYKHLGKNLLKSTTSNAVSAGVGLFVNVGEVSTTSVDFMKQAAVKGATGATDAALEGGNIFKGTLVSIVGGAVSDKVSQSLPDSIGNFTALDAAISSGIQGTVGSLINKEGDPLMDGLHKATETFIVHHASNGIKAGLKCVIPPRSFTTKVVVEKTKENLEQLTEQNNTTSKEMEEKVKQQEATLLQQAELKAKIINKLTLLARISAQEGRGFDLAQAMEQVNNKIDSMNLSELQDLEKFFIASADSRSVANPQIKQAVFDKPESVQQQGNQANLDKLLAIQSRQILEAAASGTSVGISEVELGAIQAIGSTAYKFINGLAELGVDLAKLLYKGAWHATKVDLLTNPEYEGALSDEARNRLSQEIQQDRDKLNAVLSKETGKAILHGLKNHCVAEVQGIKEKAAAGDICGMAKQATEFAIDAALMASTAGSAAKITAKLSKKAGKIVGATAKEVGNVAGDAAFNAVCATAKKIRPDSTLTFKFESELRKAQRAAAIANKEITGTGRPIISKDSSRIIKEANGEVPARIVMGEVGGVELPCRLPKNNGFDQVFVQRTVAGEVEKIFIIESKYNAKGKLHLGKTKNKGLQMSKPWIKDTLNDMLVSGDSELRATAKLIRDNKEKLVYKANVLTPDGKNKWYTLLPTEEGVIVNNKLIRSQPKPK